MSELQNKAKEKLQDEMNKLSKTKAFSDKIYPYLEKRVDEDEGLAEDIMQKHKTWKKCYDYIVNRAKTFLGGKSGPVIEDTVYEWSEDYFRKDDKAEAEKEAKAKKAREERKKKTVKEKTERKKKNEKQKKPAEKKEEPAYEQLDFFSMIQ